MKSSLLLLCTLLCAQSVLADTPAQTRVKEFKTLLRSFESMGTVVRGRDAYRPDVFARQAATLKADAGKPFANFPAGSQANSRAKAEIWSQNARFKNEQATFLQRVDTLDAAARAKDMAAIRISYGAIAQSCKSCHDAFRGPAK